MKKIHIYNIKDKVELTLVENNMITAIVIIDRKYFENDLVLDLYEIANSEQLYEYRSKRNV